MTDVLKQAKDLIKRYDESGFIHRNATRLLPELVAECERLRADNNDLVANRDATEAYIDEMKALRDDLVKNCNHLRNRAQKAESELARWQKIAIDERAGKLILTRDCTQNEDAADFHHRCECGYSLEKCPIADWWREQAARELGIATGNHIRDTTKMMLTEEQRAVLEDAIDWLEVGSYDRDCDCTDGMDSDEIDVLRTMLDQSQPAWEITEGRKTALKYALFKMGESQFKAQICEESLRAMLEEAK